MPRIFDNIEASLQQALERVDAHPNTDCFILKSIILNNLFGVDIMEEATEICKLRLFLKLAAQVYPSGLGQTGAGLDHLALQVNPIQYLPEFQSSRFNKSRELGTQEEKLPKNGSSNHETRENRMTRAKAALTQRVS